MRDLSKHSRALTLAKSEESVARADGGQKANGEAVRGEGGSAQAVASGDRSQSPLDMALSLRAGTHGNSCRRTGESLPLGGVGPVGGF